MDTENIIHETELIVKNIRAMLRARHLEPPKESDISDAINRGVLRLDATKNKALALVVFVFPKRSKYTEHAPQMEPFLRRFFVEHNREHRRVPVMIVYEHIKHFVATVLRKFRADQQCYIEMHRDEIFLQQPHPDQGCPHTIVQNKAALAERFGLHYETRLSRIYTGDKMAVWLGARAGDVIHVEYASASAGTQPQYLYVVPGDPMVSQRVHTVDDDDLDADADDDDLDEPDAADDVELEDIDVDASADAATSEDT